MEPEDLEVDELVGSVDYSDYVIDGMWFDPYAIK